jgi:hypothetical protein
MLQRAQHFLAFAAIAGCVIAGLTGVPFWSFLLGGLCLSLISVWDYEKLRPRFTVIEATGMLTMANLASAADNFLVAGAAWCLGAVFRLVLQSV